ncbi:hypothetical protein BT69DRAFT_532344 [Atractiella rhizophila]|nr:hypothetical protein BT69DRAFT_532344 [Atractiella rhizophila]
MLEEDDSPNIPIGLGDTAVGLGADPGDYDDEQLDGNLDGHLDDPLGADGVDGHGDGKEGDGEKPAKKRRNRKPVTCAQCRKRKLKCDRGNPCGACRDRNEGHLCSWEDAIRLPQPNAMRDQEALELRGQLDRLEGLLGQLHSSTFSTDAGADYGMGGLLGGGGPSRNFEERSDPSRSFSVFPLASSSANMEQIITIMPLRIELDLQVQQFINDIVWTLPIFHVPTFNARYRALERITSKSDPFFISLLLAIAGYVSYWRATDQVQLIRTKIDPTQDTTVRALIGGAMEALGCAKYLQVPNLDAVRTLLILHAFFSRFESQTAGALLTIAQQIGQRLGLNRDPTKLARFNHIEIEDRRRLWALIVSTDWLHDSGRTYMCAPLQYDAMAPANAREEDITETGVITRPVATPTMMLYLVFKLQIASAARQITDRSFGFQLIPSYQNILELNNELVRLEQSLPPCLGLEWEQGQAKPLPANAGPPEFLRFFVHLMLKQQYIRLHRPFVTRGYGDGRFAFSRDTATQAARFILAMHRGLGADSRALRCWELVYHSCNALCVLAIDVYQDPNGTHAEIHRSDISSSISLLELIEVKPKSVKETLKVANALLSRSRRNRDHLLGDNPLKRKREEDFLLNGRNGFPPGRLGSEFGYGGSGGCFLF